jgi:hypothetical protein
MSRSLKASSAYQSAVSNPHRTSQTCAVSPPRVDLPQLATAQTRNPAPHLHRQQFLALEGKYGLLHIFILAHAAFVRGCSRRGGLDIQAILGRQSYRLGMFRISVDDSVLRLNIMEDMSRQELKEIRLYIFHITTS